MWDTMIKIKEAKRALQDGRLEEAFRLASDPEVKDHRRARDIRERSLEKIYTRALEHQKTQNLSQAYLDVNLVLSGGERTDEAVRLAREIRESLEKRKELEKFHSDLLSEARGLLDRGELDQVQRLLEPFSKESPAVEGLRKQVEVRRTECEQMTSRGLKEIRKSELDKAKSSLASARRLNSANPNIEELEREILKSEGEQRLSRATDLHQGGDLDGAWDELRYADLVFPEIRESRSYKKIREATRKKLQDAFEKDLDAGRFEAARDAIHRLSEFEGELPDLPRWLESLEAVDRAQELRGQGQLRVSQKLLEAASKEFSRPKVCDKGAKELQKEIQETSDAEAAALKLVAEGAPQKAIQVLQNVVSHYPQNRGLRDQLHRVERVLRDGSELLQKANGLVHRGEYWGAREACLDLCGRPGFASTGQDLLKRIHSALDLAATKLAVAELALLNSTSGRGELEEARKNVSEVLELVRDHPGAQSVASRLDCAGQALTECERGEGHERLEDVEGSLGCYRKALQLWPENARLSVVEARLARRVGGFKLSESEKLYAQGETRLAADRVQEALALLPEASRERRRAGALQETIEKAKIEGEALLQVARDRAAKGQYREAEEALDHLDQRHPGHAEVRRTRRIIQRGRAMEEESAAGSENGNAKELYSFSNSPEDRNLADRIRDRLRQGRGGGKGFILRVEEGGEFLVLTSSDLTVGNILSKDVDLPIMANISRVHARLVRSRDFHRGECYRVLSQGGAKCFVNGKAVRDHTLQHGDRLRLGSDLEMIFELPTEKSVTAVLHLQGDFAVDGINKIVLMKPGGTDGKILLSSGTRSHVPVQCLKRDVEIHCTGGDGEVGQLICTSLAGVEVEGRGGRPEEKFHPGDVVQCGDLKFTVAHRAYS